MRPPFLLRLLFDLAAAGLLVFEFSHWWLGNVAHEAAGTALFVLLVAHNVFNRRYWRAVGRLGGEALGVVDLLMVIVLLIAMVTLLVTSIGMSHVLAGLGSPFRVGFTARQIHMLAAYWALVIVAVHIGLRWPIVMGGARNLFGQTEPNRARTVALRLVAFAAATLGVWSSFELGFGGHLTMRVSLDWWNFEDSVAPFFVHCLAIVCLWASLAHLGAELLRRRRRVLRRLPAASTRKVVSATNASPIAGASG